MSEVPERIKAMMALAEEIGEMPFKVRNATYRTIEGYLVNSVDAFMFAKLYEWLDKGKAELASLPLPDAMAVMWSFTADVLVYLTDNDDMATLADTYISSTGYRLAIPITRSKADDDEIASLASTYITYTGHRLVIPTTKAKEWCDE